MPVVSGGSSWLSMERKPWPSLQRGRSSLNALPSWILPGLYLTVDPSSRPNTDTVYHSKRWHTEI